MILLAICLALFLRGIHGQPAATPSSLLSLPMGSIDPVTFIQGWDVDGLAANVFIANSPQIILSMIYLTYNGLFTCFLLGVEWNSFASKRKGLRVSDIPVGEQQPSFFLQLPLRWAAPLMLLSAMLHWLCSQSIFVVRMEFDHSVFKHINTRNNTGCTYGVEGAGVTGHGPCLDQYIDCGYSPVAILTTFLLGVVMILVAVLLGCQRYKTGGMPVVGSCSAAISASCHLLEGLNHDELSKTKTLEKHEEHLKLQWGEIGTSSPPLTENKELAAEESETSASIREVGHCGFSAQEVRVPQEGKLYAGFWKPSKSSSS
jgi:hypothetical protein